MKIVADENIFLVNAYFGDEHTLLLKPGRAITQSDLIDADILLVRSVTKVNAALLKNTRVKFVGSVTTGADHIDQAWLHAHGIQLSVASGCNATAVVEYVVCVIAALQKMQLLTEKNLRAGVVGVGRIGGAVAKIFEILGFNVVLCDPLRQDILSTKFDALTDLDVISLHTPLTHEGAYPTYHLMKQDFLARQKKNCVLLNSGRGAVIDTAQLKLYGQELLWCFDVWENEPNIDAEILESALIATPHIAGYSLQSKYRGIKMIYDDAVRQGVIEQASIKDIPYPKKIISFHNATLDWREVVLTIFDPLAETKKMKQTLLEDENQFDNLRKNFQERDEFGFSELREIRLAENDRVILQQLGLSSLRGA